MTITVSDEVYSFFKILYCVTSTVYLVFVIRLIIMEVIEERKWKRKMKDLEGD